MDEKRLEQLTVALNRLLYDQSIGLPFQEEQANALAVQLKNEYRQALDEPACRDWALDGLADMQSARWLQRLSEKVDSVLAVPEIAVHGEIATCHNWKHMERELPAAARRKLFAEFVSRSVELACLIEEHYTTLRRSYADHGTMPLQIFAHREGTTPEAIRALALAIGQVCREPFEAALKDMARQVFGSDRVSAPELRALYLNRMYEPLAPLFATRDALADARATFAGLGFDIDHVSLDVQDRPKKYAGAFCFPVQIPGDVRISVRPASPHHLADMLFHEFGHAVHFSGIDPTLSFADRYWVHTGRHETIATLFESLLGLPGFLSDQLGLNEQATRQLVVFDRFKNLITGTWLVAEGLTVCDAWMEHLTWTQIEQRYAQYCEQFTGIAMPPGFARLDLYVSRVDSYVLGYIMAAVRVAYWLEEMQTDWGVRWWADERAGQAIRERIRLGGALKFEDEWLDPAPFARHWGASADR